MGIQHRPTDRCTTRRPSKYCYHLKEGIFYVFPGILRYHSNGQLLSKLRCPGPVALIDTAIVFWCIFSQFRYPKKKHVFLECSATV